MPCKLYRGYSLYRANYWKLCGGVWQTEKSYHRERQLGGYEHIRMRLASSELFHQLELKFSSFSNRIINYGMMNRHGMTHKKKHPGIVEERIDRDEKVESLRDSELEHVNTPVI